MILPRSATAELGGCNIRLIASSAIDYGNIVLLWLVDQGPLRRSAHTLRQSTSAEHMQRQDFSKEWEEAVAVALAIGKSNGWNWASSEG